MAGDLSTSLNVDHFRNILQGETKQLTELCEKWSEILAKHAHIEEHNNQNDNNNLDLDQDSTNRNEKLDFEDLLGSIRSTIGQAKLLMSQRFKQFSQLIDQCEFNTGPQPTRLNDLDGFWEMISYQVSDVLEKFKSLDTRIKCI